MDSNQPYQQLHSPAFPPPPHQSLYPPTPADDKPPAAVTAQYFPPPPSNEKSPFDSPTEPGPPPPPSCYKPPSPEKPRPSQVPSHTSPPTGPSPAPALAQDEVGTFNGGSYRISHRSTNTLLTLQLAINAPVQAKPGAMIGISPSVTLSGNFKFALRKFIAGASLTASTFTGPGEVLLAPAMMGDVAVLHLDGADAEDERKTWRVGKENWLACTAGVHKDVKAQTVGKAFFSGEGWYTYVLAGKGVAWVSSFGAIIRKDLKKDEQYMVDNNHLVAWNAKYVLRRIASGGIISELSTAEGVVCCFTGPGTVYLQTRSPQSFASWLGGHGAVK